MPAFRSIIVLFIYYTSLRRLRLGLTLIKSFFLIVIRLYMPTKIQGLHVPVGHIRVKIQHHNIERCDGKKKKKKKKDI